MPRTTSSRTVAALLFSAVVAVPLSACNNETAAPPSAGAKNIEPAEFRPLGWGDTYTYSDGSTMRINAPTEWESPIYSDEDQDGRDDDPDDTDPRRLVKVAFTFTNHTPAPIAGFPLGTVNSFVAIKDVPAEEVQPYNYLDLRGFGGVPVLPGRSGTVETVWLAPREGFRMTAGWKYKDEPAIFEGQLPADPAPAPPGTETSAAEEETTPPGDSREYVPYGPLDPRCDPSLYECGPDACDPLTNPEPCGDSGGASGAKFCTDYGCDTGYTDANGNGLDDFYETDEYREYDPHWAGCIDDTTPPDQC